MQTGTFNLSPNPTKRSQGKQPQEKTEPQTRKKSAKDGGISQKLTEGREDNNLLSDNGQYQMDDFELQRSINNS